MMGTIYTLRGDPQNYAGTTILRMRIKPMTLDVCAGILY